MKSGFWFWWGFFTVTMSPFCGATGTRTSVDSTNRVPYHLNLTCDMEEFLAEWEKLSIIYVGYIQFWSKTFQRPVHTERYNVSGNANANAKIGTEPIHFAA